jgi:hypothetical protein
MVNMRTVIGGIKPQLLSWFTSTQRISASLTMRPVTPASHERRPRSGIKALYKKDREEISGTTLLKKSRAHTFTRSTKN